MTKQPIRGAAPARGHVTRVGSWAVGDSDGELFAASRRCRHQLADLSKGSIGKDGCLVCPWHGARYDTTTGAMVRGPRGFFWYRGKTPGYTALVLAYGRWLKLRLRRVVRLGDGEVELR